MFSSRPPFNGDPYGWVCTEGPSCRHSRKLAPTTYWKPRPEFDRPQHNPTNPILEAFRDHVATQWVYLPEVSTYAEDVETFDGLRDDSFIGTTPDQIDHARRVLARLASLTKEN